jgi:DNA-binding response OmpR family regulator
VSARILLVEDNSDLAFGLQRNLEFEGYEVEIAENGRIGLARALTEEHDLVILDLMLPELDGVAVLQHLRAARVVTPVLILTAKNEELDKVRGLRTGADDYVTKPFGVLELVARVEALLRRTGKGGGGEVRDSYRFGDIEVDLRSRAVRRGGEDVALTPREFGLLVALLRDAGTALSRHDLLRDVWGHKADVETRTIDTHIGELRRKLEPDSTKPRYILTVRKFGYRMDVDGLSGGEG